MNNPKHLLVVKKLNMFMSVLNLLLVLLTSYFIYLALNNERETYFYSNEGFIRSLDYSDEMNNKIKMRLKQ